MTNNVYLTFIQILLDPNITAKVIELDGNTYKYTRARNNWCCFYVNNKLQGQGYTNIMMRLFKKWAQA